MAWWCLCRLQFSLPNLKMHQKKRMDKTFANLQRIILGSGLLCRCHVRLHNLTSYWFHNWGSANWCYTVDGSEIRRSPVDMVNIPINFSVFIHPRWLAAFLPTTVFFRHTFCSKNQVVGLDQFCGWKSRGRRRCLEHYNISGTWRVIPVSK